MELKFDEYQRRALETRTGDSTEKQIRIATLGLAGEVGSVLSVLKKRIRDGEEAYTGFTDKFKEEIGDTLWYLTNLADLHDLQIGEIAFSNLKKVEKMWVDGDGKYRLLDETFPPNERIPMEFVIEFYTQGSGVVRLRRDGVALAGGNPLTDNAHNEDGYRYHDAFHFSYAAILGWSPVVRYFFKAKRKTKSEFDQVEDGARAILAEELISLLAFHYAGEYNFFRDVASPYGIPMDIIGQIRRIVGDLEVDCRANSDWQKAIFHGYKVFRELCEHGSGFVRCNLSNRTIEYSRDDPQRSGR